MLDAKNILYWDLAFYIANFQLFLFFCQIFNSRIILKENFPDEILLW